MREALIEAGQRLYPVKQKLYCVIGFLSIITLLFVVIIYTVKSGKSGCVDNNDCSPDMVCSNHKCVDPCVGLCGPNTTCHIVNRVTVCSCHPGHSGNPVIGCKPSHSSNSPIHIDANQSCSAHHHCSGKEFCISGRCSKTLDESGVLECTISDQCSYSKACILGTCSDPCEHMCGLNANCKVYYHVPACACQEGHIGNPLILCSPVPPVITPDYPTAPRGKKGFYLENDRSVDWHHAFVYCLQNNSRLASVDNEEELREINHLIMESGGREKSYWTSGTDVGREGHFVWASTMTPINMTSKGLWSLGEPNNSFGVEEDCVELRRVSSYSDYTLNDIPCSKERYFICEYYEEQ